MKAAFLFPGQGSQRKRMGHDWAAGFPIARQTFEEASEILGYDVLALCLGDDPKFSQTEYTQPLLVAVSTAIARVVKSELSEVVPEIVAGHSAGEFSALVAAGALEFGDALRLVRRRGQLMQLAMPEGVGTMASVYGLSAEVVEDTCAGQMDAVIATYNTRDQFVISGKVHAVKTLGEALTKRGAVVQALDISIPAHSTFMQSAMDALRPEIHGHLLEARIPLLSNRDANLYQEADDLERIVLEQLVRPVRWSDCMRSIAESNVQVVIECGPGTVLRDLFRAEHTGVRVFSLTSPNVLPSIRSIGAPVLATSTTTRGVLGACLRACASSKNDSSDQNRYAVDVAGAYRKLLTMYREVPEGSWDEATIREGLELLRRHLKGKRLSREVAENRLRNVIVSCRVESIADDFLTS